MASDRSWAWLAPRVPVQKLSDDARAASAASPRPCLTAVEALGDRLMFSITTDGVPIEQQAPVTSAEILIGMLKGTFEGDNALVKVQLDLIEEAAADYFLKIGGIKFGDAVQVTHNLVKINNAIYKYVDDILVGKATPLLKVQAQVDDALSKLTEFAKLVDAGDGAAENGLLLPAVQKVREAAGAILTDVSQQVVKVSLDSKVYSKVNTYFSDITDGLLKLGQDVTYERKAGKGQQEYLQVKFQDVLITSFKVSDGDIKGELGELIGVAQGVYADVLDLDGGDGGGDGGDGGDGGGPIFLGGLRVEEDGSDDVLS